MRKHIGFVVIAFLTSLAVRSQGFYHEPYRPQFHFTPAIHWTNDPNGLVYYKGEYHLFYQFNPFGNRWGHMTWGHAVSRDLVSWEHLPIAIAEEKDTMIFSGSCVIDVNNTSGFAKAAGQVPMIAIYTAHIDNLNQSQHLAYSLDDGRTWTKYDHNPVLDLGKKDFRDPKVFWYSPGKKWVMAVMIPDEKRVQFYSSSDIKKWTLMSEFGPAGDVSGIWECPDLFEAPIMDQPGKKKWVFMHSPAPYMQYFVGEFDGTRFISETDTSRIYRPDDGPDYYAAIAFNNLPANSPPISIGWANNWNYANDIPTLPWKSAMSLPRELSVKKINGEWILMQRPVRAVNTLRGTVKTFANLSVTNTLPIAAKGQTLDIEMDFTVTAGAISGIRLAKDKDQYIEIGYDRDKERLYVDRSKSGQSDFNANFAKLSRYESVLKTTDGKISLRILFDKSLVEVFANNGERVMTAQLFPSSAQQGIELFSNKKVVVQSLKVWQMKSIW